MALYYEDEYVQLHHGDCRAIRGWTTAAVLITDPPYGSEGDVGYGRFGANGRAKDATFKIAGDKTTEVRDAILSMWGDKPRMVFGSPRLPEPPGEWRDRLVWDRREPGLNGGAWRYTHESIFVGGDGWVRTSASSFSILSTPAGNGTWEKGQHVHYKPTALMEALVATAPQGTIADPFAGSGSTLIAARNLGRKVIGVELEERYCELIVKRLSQQAFDFTSLEALA